MNITMAVLYALLLQGEAAEATNGNSQNDGCYSTLPPAARTGQLSDFKL